MHYAAHTSYREVEDNARWLKIEGADGPGKEAVLAKLREDWRELVAAYRAGGGDACLKPEGDRSCQLNSGHWGACEGRTWAELTPEEQRRWRLLND